MILIQTALAFEALPAVEYYGLSEIKERSVPSRFFGDPGKSIFLVITGTGAVSASAGVAAALSFLKPEKSDLFFNFGIAGAPDGKRLKKGDTVRAVKCTSSLGRPFYPDVIYGTRFDFAEVRTVSGPSGISGESCIFGESFISGECSVAGLPLVFDMELYGAFRAANMFLPPHSLISIKTVSDFSGETAANGGKTDKKTAEAIVSESWKTVFPELDRIAEEAGRAAAEEETANRLPGGAEALYEELCAKLRLSYANRELLRNRLKKDALIGVDVKQRLENVLSLPDRTIPGDKKGRERFLRETVFCDEALSAPRETDTGGERD